MIVNESTYVQLTKDGQYVFLPQNNFRQLYTIWHMRDTTGEEDLSVAERVTSWHMVPSMQLDTLIFRCHQTNWHPESDFLVITEEQHPTAWKEISSDDTSKQ